MIILFVNTDSVILLHINCLDCREYGDLCPHILNELRDLSKLKTVVYK